MAIKKSGWSKNGVVGLMHWFIYLYLSGCDNVQSIYADRIMYDQCFKGSFHYLPNCTKYSLDGF